jgi:hypothetical protein
MKQIKDLVYLIQHYIGVTRKLLVRAALLDEPICIIFFVRETQLIFPFR